MLKTSDIFDIDNWPLPYRHCGDHLAQGWDGWRRRRRNWEEEEGKSSISDDYTRLCPERGSRLTSCASEWLIGLDLYKDRKQVLMSMTVLYEESMFLVAAWWRGPYTDRRSWRPRCMRQCRLSASNEASRYTYVIRDKMPTNYNTAHTLRACRITLSYAIDVYVDLCMPPAMETQTSNCYRFR